MANCQLGVGDEYFTEAGIGLHQLCCMIEQGKLKFGQRVVVICLLGRADVVEGCQYAGVLERFLKACTTFAPDTHIVLGGPFPEFYDQPPLLAKMWAARHYTEDRIAAESHFHYSGIAFRYGEPLHGINPHLMSEGGLTTRGCEVLRRDLCEVVSVIPGILD